MPVSARRRWAGWLVVTLTVVFAVAAFMVLFRISDRGVRSTPGGSASKVQLTRLDGGMGDSILQEQATLFDPTPLFLPTEWNTNQRPLPAAVRRQPGQVFQTFEPKLRYGEAELTLPVASVQALPTQPGDLLREPSHDPFLGFDREDVTVSALSSRQAYLEVRKVDTGEIVLTRSLEGGAPPLAARVDWQPAEFLVNVTAAGMLGRPVDMASSEVEELDSFFRDYLAKTLRLGERLPPGIYQVAIGP
jgi:hypothetical protein